jgi:HEPN domain-containing protein
MNGNIELAKSWFQIADEDILAAEHELAYEDAVLRSVCFHSQQAVEKYLKGFLIYHSHEFPFTHNIALLQSKIIEHKLEIDLTDIQADQLTTFAAESRYPEPESLINLEIAKEALSIAKEVKNRILQKVQF